MKTIVFTLKRTDDSILELEYQPFDNNHSRQWLDLNVQSYRAGNPIVDMDRVYNFNPSNLVESIVRCNQLIDKINKKYDFDINSIRLSTAQVDVNKAHIHFADLNKTFDQDWLDFNILLHGLEIELRGGGGQIYTSLPNQSIEPLSSESYGYFTIKKHWGYCYANYPHVGRHILEMFNARDKDAHDEHVIPMTGITGSSYLYFGRSDSPITQLVKWLKIKSWFKQNRIDTIVGMKWGDPRLAIGWLPVARLVTKINNRDLTGLVKLVNIKIK